MPISFPAVAGLQAAGSEDAKEGNVWRPLINVALPTAPAVHNESKNSKWKIPETHKF